jgi:translation elongation factor EF-Ts
LKRNDGNKKGNYNLIDHHILFDEIFNHLTIEENGEQTIYKQKQNISNMLDNHLKQIEAAEKIIEGKLNSYSNNLALPIRITLQTECTDNNL